MLVYLLRHAIAEERAASDSLRELTPEGMAQAISVTEKFRQYSPVMDRVLCSPYVRAQQTASCLMQLFPGLDSVPDESIKPGGDVFDVIDVIGRQDVQHLMLVSHNPLLSNLLSVLVDGTLESHRYVGNAVLYCLSMDVVAPGCGEIVFTVEP
ncbi:MAG: phosphohistidine phosphatase SixA [Pseudohongiellaceae bacterium]